MAKAQELPVNPSVLEWARKSAGISIPQAAQELKVNLRLAQTRAFSGEKPVGCTILDGYQVSFSAGPPDSYSIQAMCSGVLVGGAKVFSLPATVTFAPLPSSIFFKVLALGANNPNPNDLITLNYPGVGNETVTVTEAGEIR